jgi:hypothetical protein
MLGVGCWKLEVRGWMLGAGCWELEAGSLKLEVLRQKIIINIYV